MGHIGYAWRGRRSRPWAEKRADCGLWPPGRHFHPGRPATLLARPLDPTRLRETSQRRFQGRSLRGRCSGLARDLEFASSAVVVDLQLPSFSVIAARPPQGCSNHPRGNLGGPVTSTLSLTSPRPCSEARLSADSRRRLRATVPLAQARKATVVSPEPGRPIPWAHGAIQVGPRRQTRTRDAVRRETRTGLTISP